MRRFMLGIATIFLTMVLIVGGGLLLARQEAVPEALPKETVAVMAESTQATEETFLPVETETAQISDAETIPEKVKIEKIPRYYQTDYPYIMFGNNTIATSGCSITCLAMVATYLLDQEYTPPQMAYHFGNYGKNNIERLDYGIAQMRLPYERTEDIRDVFQGLREGKLAILMMDDESVFTTEQHFIVAAGMSEDGKFIVHDPLETNYTKAQPNVKDGYDHGFADFYLMQGFSGGWLFDKEAMPENPFVFDASMPEQQTNRYEGYILTEEDIYTLACFARAEAENEPKEVRQAVVEVVLNRLISDDYPDTVQGILKHTELYRAMEKIARMDEPGLKYYLAVDAAMYGPYILPEDVCFYSVWEKGEEVWGQLGSYTFAKKR